MLDVLRSLDGGALLWIQNVIRQDWLNPLVETYTHLGDAGMLWIVLCIAFLFFKPTRKAGVVGLMALAVGFLCTNVVLKHLVGRPRPWLDVMELLPLIQEGDPNSFPSGHTCASFAAASAWWRLLPEKWMGAIAGIMALGMGLTRLYVGVHYPSDVLAGALVGLFSGWAAWKLFQTYFREKR